MSWWTDFRNGIYQGLGIMDKQGNLKLGQIGRHYGQQIKKHARPVQRQQPAPQPQAPTPAQVRSAAQHVAQQTGLPMLAVLGAGIGFLAGGSKGAAIGGAAGWWLERGQRR